MICAAVVLYQAFVNHDHLCIILICIHLGIAYGDSVYKKRHDSVGYGFIKGFTGEKP